MTRINPYTPGAGTRPALLVDAMVQVMEAERAGASTTPGFRSARVSSGKVAALLEKPLNAVGPIRDRVIKKGIIHSPQFGTLEFSVPGFADYVSRRTAAGAV